MFLLEMLKLWDELLLALGLLPACGYVWGHLRSKTVLPFPLCHKTLILSLIGNMELEDDVV